MEVGCVESTSVSTKWWPIRMSSIKRARAFGLSISRGPWTERAERSAGGMPLMRDNRQRMLLHRLHRVQVYSQLSFIAARFLTIFFITRSDCVNGSRIVNREPWIRSKPFHDLWSRYPDFHYNARSLIWSLKLGLVNMRINVIVGLNLVSWIPKFDPKYDSTEGVDLNFDPNLGNEEAWSWRRFYDPFWSQLWICNRPSFGLWSHVRFPY